MTKTLTDPLVALQKAQYATLSTDADLLALGVKVFDHVNEDHYPRVVIGEDRESPEDMECETFTEVFPTVRVYSRAVGKLQAKEIAGHVRWLLDYSNGFTVEGFRLLSGHCINIDIHPHEDESTTQAELTFKYWVIPAPDVSPAS